MDVAVGGNLESGGVGEVWSSKNQDGYLGLYLAYFCAIPKGKYQIHWIGLWGKGKE